MNKKHTIKKKSWEEIQGFILDKKECIKLQELAMNKTCLEIGSYKGKTTVAMSEFAKYVYAVDTFKADGGGQTQMGELTTLEEFKSNIYGRQNIVVCIGKSEDVVPKINVEFDFIFIDGMHDYESIKKDIQICLPRLKEDGIIAFHDYNEYYGDNVKYDGIKKAVDERFNKISEPIFSLVWANKKDIKTNEN